MSAVVDAVGVIIAIVSAYHIGAAVSGFLFDGRRIRAGDDGSLDLPGVPVVRRPCHYHRRVGLPVLGGISVLGLISFREQLLMAVRFGAAIAMLVGVYGGLMAYVMRSAALI